MYIIILKIKKNRSDSLRLADFKTALKLFSTKVDVFPLN